MRVTFRRAGLATLALIATMSFVGVAQASSGDVAPGRQIAGVEAGDGSLVVAGSSKPFIPRGFNSVGVLYPEEYPDMCGRLTQDQRDQLQISRNRMDEHAGQQFEAMQEYWNANAVRLQTSQGALAREYKADGANPYTDAVINTVREAREQGLVVLVSVQTQAYSCTPLVNDEAVKLPDADTLAAWQQLAPALRSDKGIVLEIFNEPQTKTACDTGQDYTWEMWRYGCDGDQNTGVDGMVPLGDRVNELAPDNVLLFDGDNNGGKFNNFEPIDMPDDNVAFAVHPYHYVDGPTGNAQGEGWDERYGHLQESGEPVLATEWNGSLSCKEKYAGELVGEYLPGHDIGLFVHSWDAPAAVLVDHESGSYDPVDSVDKCETFTGASLAYDEFWNWGR